MTRLVRLFTAGFDRRGRFASQALYFSDLLTLDKSTPRSPLVKRVVAFNATKLTKRRRDRR